MTNSCSLANLKMCKVRYLLLYSSLLSLHVWNDFPWIQILDFQYPPMLNKNSYRTHALHLRNQCVFGTICGSWMDPLMRSILNAFASSKIHLQNCIMISKLFLNLLSIKCSILQKIQPVLSNDLLESSF